MHRIIIISLFFFIVSCRNGNSYDDIIPKDSLIEIIYDFHLHNALIREYNFLVKPDYAKKDVYNAVYLKYSITEKQLIKNIIYYTQTGEIDKLYEKVINKATIERGIIESRRMNEAPK